MYAVDLPVDDFDEEFLTRFWARVDKRGPNGCWVWKGATNGREPTGGQYGMLRLHHKKMLVHRVSYIIAKGSIPAKLFIDHLCHNKLCVNPAHLQAVSNKQNCENLNGSARKNGCGVRGVTWDAEVGKWKVQVVHNRKHYSGGRYKNIEDAKAAAIELRKKLFTHDMEDWTPQALDAITGAVVRDFGSEA